MKKEMINWTFYSKRGKIESNNFESVEKLNEKAGHLQVVIDCFNKNLHKFSSKEYTYKSNEVLKLLGKIDGYKIEKSKKETDLIKLLCDEENSVFQKYENLFCVDAYNEEKKTVLEVEAGRASCNNQFLKDFFEACVSSKVDYLIVAVRKIYRDRNDYEYVNKYFDVMLNSRFMNNLPLEGILVIGY